jgi:Tfp pilus assembly protein PilF
MVARASWLLGDFHDANSLFTEATRLDPSNLEAQVLWGELFLEKYNAADAQRSFEDALAVNSRYLPALVGIARVTGNREALERALAINPSSVLALETQAQLLFINDAEEEALAAIDEALAINPESMKSLSLLGAKAALEEREQDFAELRARIDAFSPNNPQFLGDVADTLGKQYRFVEAVALAREAIASDPNYWQGYTLLGSNLIRLGEEEEGRANLEIGFDNDPFNVMTSNMLKVYDTLDSYLTLESEHFKVNMSEKDGQILWPYLEPLLEESWDTLTMKYGFEPEGPILIQVFENSQDFAVRSVGLPDIGPLVGICFGKVITLISPDTLSANWQEIAWHEFAHVVTLQMTGNKMPRWLSEGISVWEEREGRPYWGRSQGLDLVRAFEQEKLLSFEDLDKGFSGAQNSADLNFAYFQSYLVVDYIAREYGFEGLRELVLQYDDIKSDTERFREAFDVSLAEFDSGFLNWVEQRVAEIGVYVHKEDAPDEGEGHGHGVRENSSAVLAELYNNASLKQHMGARIEANPKDFQAHLQLGIVLFKEEAFDEARLSLETAYQLLPEYTGYPSPPLVLAQIYEKLGDEPARLGQLRLLLENQQHDYASAMTLASHALDSGNLDEAAYYIDRALQVDPYRRDVHTLRAQLATLTGDTALAVKENEVIVTLEVDDPVEARTNLAEAYLNNGDAALAKRNVLSALEIAPSYVRAQQVLLRAAALATAADGGGE